MRLVFNSYWLQNICSSYYGIVTALSLSSASLRIFFDDPFLNWLSFQCFFRDLINEGIFHVIEEVLQIPDKKLVLTGYTILLTNY